MKALLAAALPLLLASCQSMGISFLKFGSTDRKEALISEVRKVQEIQFQTETDFTTTMGLFKKLVTGSPEELDKLYDNLQDGVDDCQDDVEALHKHIDTTEEDATKLFEEWRTELDQFSHPELRQKSEAMLEDTVQRYSQLRDALLKSEKALDPVMAAFQDYVLFFNHNLNPRAIATLGDTYPKFLDGITALRKDIEGAAAETDRFVRMVEGRATPQAAAKPAPAPKS